MGAGVVLESHLKQGSGTNLTTVIRWGNFHVGSICVLGDQIGKIKSILKDGKNVKIGYAGDTVVISGINHTIKDGEWLFEVKNEAFANEVQVGGKCLLYRLLIIVNDVKKDVKLYYIKKQPMKKMKMKKMKKMRMIRNLLQIFQLF